MRRILIVRMGSLGDIVHTLPAAATLKRVFPQAELDWVVEQQWAPLLDQNPHLAQLHRVSTGAWRRRLGEAATWRSLAASIGALRRRRYDLALDFQGLIKSAVLARWSGAARVAGFDRAELRERTAALFYGEQVSVPSQAIHVVTRNLALAAAVGATEPVLEFACAPKEEDAARARQLTAQWERFALLSPSAGWAAKRWPEERYAELARRLTTDLRLPVAVNCGPGEETIAGRVVELAGDSRALLVHPSLGELMALAREAALVIGGDTGPIHMAAACGTPVVAIFGATDPARNGPWGPACRVVRAEGAATTYSRAADREAISRVTVDQVLRAAEELLGAGARVSRS